MTWFACGAAAITVVSSVAQGNAAASSASKVSVAENEAVIKSNLKNTIRTGYRVGLLNMQRGIAKREAVQQGFEITKQGESALGQVTANAAAAGTIGSSADAVVSDVKQKIGEAEAALQNKSEIDMSNYNTQLENITFEGNQAIQESRKSNIQSTGDIWGGALMAGASSLASNYAMGKFLGGTKTPSAGSTVPSTGSFLGSGLSSSTGIQTNFNWGA